jgi:Spy/CpxP family protein refolding chaperone
MKWALVLVVGAVFGATARPADEPIVPQGTVVKLLLLRQKSVQKELDINAETAQKIDEFCTAESEAAKKAHEKGEGAKEIYEQLTKKNDQFLADTLTPAQNKRLDQIAMQFTCLTHLTKPETAKTLNLSEEQVQKCKDLQSETRKAMVDLMESKDREGKNEKFAKLRQATREKIVALLTDDQKAKLREILGPPFAGEIVFDEHEDK